MPHATSTYKVKCGINNEESHIMGMKSIFFKNKTKSTQYIWTKLRINPKNYYHYYFFYYYYEYG
jgi:hypothetical protein